MLIGHPDEIEILPIVKSSVWLWVQHSYLIRMTWCTIASHPDDILQCPQVIRMRYNQELTPTHDLSFKWSYVIGWHKATSQVIRITYCSAVFLSHPDEIRPWADSSGWLRIWIKLCDPDDTGTHHKSSGWHPELTISHPVTYSNYAAKASKQTCKSFEIRTPEDELPCLSWGHNY